MNRTSPDQTGPDQGQTDPSGPVGADEPPDPLARFSAAELAELAALADEEHGSRREPAGPCQRCGGAVLSGGVCRDSACDAAEREPARLYRKEQV